MTIKRLGTLWLFASVAVVAVIVGLAVPVDARPGVFRKINPGTTTEMLKNQVQVKHFFANRTCVGGSPRIQLGIDRDGDGWACAPWDQVPVRRLPVLSPRRSD